MSSLPDRGTPPIELQQAEQRKRELLEDLPISDPSLEESITTVADAKPIVPRVNLEEATLDTDLFSINFKFSDVQESELCYVFVLQDSSNFNVKLKAEATEMKLSYRNHEEINVLHVGAPMTFKDLGCTLLLLLKNN